MRATARPCPTTPGPGITFLVMLATVGIAACHHGAARTLNTGSHPQRGTTVRVENRRPQDMEVDIASESEQATLGTVTGLGTAVFTIPPLFVNVAVHFRLLAGPIGGIAAPISDGITVSPGDQISTIIAPY